MYLTGLRLLSHLPGFVAFRDHEITLEILLCLAAFTDQRDPWTSQEASEVSNRLLDQYLKAIEPEPKKLNGLLSRLLKENIKPLFVKSKSKEITEQGRKAVSPLPGPFVPSDLEATNKPWKFHDVYVVTVFRWVLVHLDV